jgi:class 3 adenylate cyclase/putative methionine-R-sulfoxide reductase with GAF domain
MARRRINERRLLKPCPHRYSCNPKESAAAMPKRADRADELESENAELHRQLAESLAQQAATAEVLQVINASPGNLQPVFDAIVQKAHALCDTTHGSLFLRDGELFRPVAMLGVPERLAERLRQGLLGADAPASQPLLAGETFVQVDMGALDHPIARAAAANGVRSMLSVPLRKSGALIGMLVVARLEFRPFTDKQITLLQNFAAQAVIAIENARLLTETREALEQQTATAEVLQVINSSPGDLKPVFDAMLEKALRLCDAAFGNMQTYDGELVRTVATRGSTPEHAKDLAVPRPIIPGTNHDRLIHGEPFVQLDDVRDTELYRAGTVTRRGVADLGGARTLISVPLRMDDRCVGFFHIFRQEVRPFTDKQIALLQNFAAQAVIAMENARLLGELRQRTEEVAELNRGLEARVAEQVEELGRVGRLKRFLAPQLAELIVSQGDENILESHRREIVVVFCDLRGFTAFAETAEPEEVLDFLREYHGALGPLVGKFEGTLDQFSGDGIMVFFNDPVPIPDPAERAVKMAMAMREAAGTLTVAWRRRGHELGFGVGIAQGYATLGQIGFAERSGYTAIGTVCNLAARLCAAASDGQILVSSRVAGAVEALACLNDLGTLELKGLSRPVAAFNVGEAIAAPAVGTIE